MAEGKPGEYLISFESGHYKKFIGEWKGDSVWAHFQTDHSVIHVNKDKGRVYRAISAKRARKDLAGDDQRTQKSGETRRGKTESRDRSGEGTHRSSQGRS